MPSAAPGSQGAASKPSRLARLYRLGSALVLGGAVDEVNASGYTVGDLLDGTVFVFELRGVNAAGNGRESEPVEVTMPLDPTSWSNFRIERVSGENPFLAYGVVNDGGAPGERSGDGAYLPARQ